MDFWACFLLHLLLKDHAALPCPVRLYMQLEGLKSAGPVTASGAVEVKNTTSILNV